jgi:hypothetical protein
MPVVFGFRRGVIGFMVTMAVGLALGVATVFVGSEVAKGLQKPTPPGVAPAPVLTPIPAVRDVEEAFYAYQNAQYAYEEALAQRSPDAPQRFAEFQAARRQLERAILINTPGIPKGLPLGEPPATPTVPLRPLPPSTP